MKVTEDKVVQKLRDHCLHITRPRVEILSLIYSLKGDVISTGVITHAIGYVFDRITVYRTLQVFYKKGILKLVPNTHGVVEFLLCDQVEIRQSAPGSPAVFVCDHCNTQQQVPITELLSWQSTFPGSPREIVIKGLCTSCKT